MQSHVMTAGNIQFLVWEDYAPIEHKKGALSDYTTILKPTRNFKQSLKTR
jgi:hypothetical protein